MLDELFFNEIDFINQPANSDQNKDTNITCASYLQRPDSPRQESHFIGLFNQGSTCYLNSSLQVLFMNPLFRQIIYDLPLCVDDDISKPSNFIQTGQKYDILLALQKIFIQMEKYDVHAIQTHILTEAFKWDPSDGRFQQDSQEFIRLLLFDVLDRILINTDKCGLINSMCRLSFKAMLTCSNCHFSREKEDFDFVLPLPVNGVTNIYQSLEQLFLTPEIINDYKCESCEKKVDLEKRQKIRSLPTLLSFALNRFTYDLETGERIKLTGNFEFPLEFSMKQYISPDGIDQEEDEYTYYLYAIIIQSGTPYSGHYFSYCRDLTQTGDWNLLPLSEYKLEPTLREFKKEEPEDETKPKAQLKDESTPEETKPKSQTDCNEDKKDESKIETKEETTQDQDSQQKDVKNEEDEKTKKKKKKNPKKQQQDTNKPKQNCQPKTKKQKQEGTVKKEKRLHFKKNKEEENEYIRLNFDECDHPLEYQNKNLSERWFEFNDTVVAPIRIGRLRKQFKSSQCAYMLFYIRKSAHEGITACIPPNYLLKYVEDLNVDIQNQRSIYHEELQSMLVTVYDHVNFYIDEFNILSTEKKLEDVSVDKKNCLKMKLYHKFEKLLEEVKSCYNAKYGEGTISSIADIILYEIVAPRGSNDITVIGKYEAASVPLDNTLEQLKIVHNSRFIVSFRNCSSLPSEIIENHMGSGFEPLNIKVAYGTTEKLFRVFSHVTIDEFKKQIMDYYHIEHDISLAFKNANKTVFLDKIGYDNKNQCWLSLKQIKLNEKNLIYVLKQTQDPENITEKTEVVELEDEINCIVKLEDDENEFKVLTIKLNKTFEQLIEEIRKEYNLYYTETNENSETVQIPIQFRLRKEMDGKLIHQNVYNNKLCTDEMFVEGGVRLRIELGEGYSSHEILLKIILEIERQKIIKQFIGNPEKILLSEIKGLVCSQFNLKNEEHMFYKVNCFQDPIKAIKNENQLISKAGLKDTDYVWLKNISSELYETYFIRIYIQESGAQDNDYIFKAINEDKFALELTLPKDTTLKVLKENIISNLSLETTPNMLRVRVIGKHLDPERIIKGENTVLKKFNIDNPGKLMVELLPEDEQLKDCQIQLYLWKRNCETRSYYDKQSIIFEYVNKMASSDQLYELCRKVTGWNNITIAKHSKGYYTWEHIPEMESEGPVNLRKGNYNLKDGDWIGIRNDEDMSEKEIHDDFLTKEDQIILENMKKTQVKESNAKRKLQIAERPLRINLDT